MRINYTVEQRHLRRSALGGHAAIYSPGGSSWGDACAPAVAIPSDCWTTARLRDLPLSDTNTIPPPGPSWRRVKFWSV